MARIDKGRRTITCASCHSRKTIRHLDLILVQFYVEPYSCMGGDYWTTGSDPEMNYACPSCGVLNRLLFDFCHPLSVTERLTNSHAFLRRYGPAFHSVIYKKRPELDHYSWINNFSVDRNSKKWLGRNWLDIPKLRKLSEYGIDGDRNRLTLKQTELRMLGR